MRLGKKIIVYSHETRIEALEAMEEQAETLRAEEQLNKNNFKIIILPISIKKGFYYFIGNNISRTCFRY